MDISSLNAYTDSISNSASTSSADKLTSSIKGFSPQSTYEEIEGATKSFESYFLEQVIKEFKDSVNLWNDDEDEDASMSQIRDMYMDQSIQSIAEQMVNQSGGRITRDLTNQIARNYGIEIPADKK